MFTWVVLFHLIFIYVQYVEVKTLSQSNRKKKYRPVKLTTSTFQLTGDYLQPLEPIHM